MRTLQRSALVEALVLELRRIEHSVRTHPGDISVADVEALLQACDDVVSALTGVVMSCESM